MSVTPLDTYRDAQEAERVAQWDKACETFHWDDDVRAALSVARDAGRRWGDLTCIAFSQSALGTAAVIFPDGMAATSAGMCRLSELRHADA